VAHGGSLFLLLASLGLIFWELRRTAAQRR
jgi:hypothetical protein